MKSLSLSQAAEMKSLAGNQTSRQSFMAGGLTLAGVKCTVLRDQLDVDGSYCMDIRTKSSETEPDTFSICIAKSNKGLFLLFFVVVVVSSCIFCLI